VIGVCMDLVFEDHGADLHETGGGVVRERWQPASSPAATIARWSVTA